VAVVKEAERLADRRPVDILPFLFSIFCYFLKKAHE